MAQTVWQPQRPQSVEELEAVVPKEAFKDENWRGEKEKFWDSKTVCSMIFTRRTTVFLWD